MNIPKLKITVRPGWFMDEPADDETASKRIEEIDRALVSANNHFLVEWDAPMPKEWDTIELMDFASVNTIGTIVPIRDPNSMVGVIKELGPWRKERTGRGKGEVHIYREITVEVDI